MAGQEVFIPKSTIVCVDVRPSHSTGEWFAILHQDFEVHAPSGRDLLGEVENYQPKLRFTGRVEKLSCTYSLKSSEKPKVEVVQKLIGLNPKLRIVRLLSSYIDHPAFRAKRYGQSHGDQAGLLILDQHNRPEYVRSYLSDGRDNLCGEVDQRTQVADQCAALPDELLGLYPASLKYVEQLREQKGQRPNDRIPAPIAAQLARAMR